MFFVLINDNMFGAFNCYSFESIEDATDYAKRKFEEGYRNVKIMKEVQVNLNVNIAI
ncbi:hypothetical protein ACNQFZ_18420 [Schinkia sp. CFF1]